VVVARRAVGAPVRLGVLALGIAGAGLGVVGAHAAAPVAALASAPASELALSARQHRPLDGPWSFHRVTPRKDAPEPWLPATVPGCVHTDLLANGKIGDPFFRLNEKDQQWIDRESWEYRTVVRVDREMLARARAELVFAGLDTFAEVFVNGQTVLFANNMFRSWRADVKAALHAGDNVVVVRFRSPIEQVQGAYRDLGYRLPAANDQAPEMVSMWARKAPYHYGWDWGPRFVTSGIWRPVALETWDDARIDDVQLFQKRLDAAAADLTVKVRVVAAASGRARIAVAVAGGAPLAQADVELALGSNDLSLPVRIDRPELWWPNGLGPQRLYTLETKLSNAGGQLRDTRRTRIGLRSLEVVHQRDAAGKSFFVRVNGAPVFMKGANWIPADSFNARVTPERYRFLLQSAVTAHMNMVRVWGGGIYEDDQFYDLCDELGILVWQDFMFACSMYPGDEAFVGNVRQEVTENVRRLRNHPSLALWAGNNENEAAWKGWGWPAKFHLSPKAQQRISADYKQMFHQLLPSIVAAEDAGRFYTRSSPSANEDDVPANRMGWGDMHYWGVWHAEHPYTSYADNISRFMSEYGFQSFPELSSVARYTAPETDRDIGSPVMLSHQRHPRGNALIRTYMDRDFRRPKDFASFLYVGQVLQATVIKFAAEAHRRAMGRNWGSLYWQLDDCWPVASWSSIDYYGRWKALQYFARQFFAPVLVSPIEEKGDGKGNDKGGVYINVWAVSDRRVDSPARLAVRLLDFDGHELWRKEQDVVLAANASRVYLSMRKAEALGNADPTRVVLVTELSERGQPLARNLLSFVKTKDLALPRPALTLDVATGVDVGGVGVGGALAVTIASPTFARNVYLTAGAGGLPGAAPLGFFEDNFFDLLPGQTRTVVFHPAGTNGTTGTLTPQALRAALRATTIADSY
jgi:beta-mannosidase